MTAAKDAGIHAPLDRLVRAHVRGSAVRYDCLAEDAETLDAIEHEILRPDFDEPRIHFAINCASVSCPDLRAEAYVAARLDEQLDDATRRFLRDPDKGARTGDEKGLLFGVHRALRVSSLFDWFEEDFTAGGDTVVDYVLPYLGDKDRRYVERHRDDLALRFLSYDWSLNDR